MKKQLSVIIFSIVICTIPYTNTCGKDLPIGQSPQKVYIGGEGIEHLGYPLYLPSSYHSDQTKNRPLILFLHGMGEICSGGDPFRACILRDLPVWAFHGAKDTTVSPDESKYMVDAITKCGGNEKFTLYPEFEHDCWTATYDNPELHKWFLEQSLMNRKR